jgi:hypothetical protein
MLKTLPTHKYTTNTVFRTALQDGTDLFVAVHFEHLARTPIGPNILSVEKTIQRLLDREASELNALPSHPCFYFEYYINNEDDLMYFAKYEGAYEFVWYVFSVTTTPPPQDDFPETSYEHYEECLFVNENEQTALLPVAPLQPGAPSTLGGAIGDLLVGLGSLYESLEEEQKKKLTQSLSGTLERTAEIYAPTLHYIATGRKKDMKTLDAPQAARANQILDHPREQSNNPTDLYVGDADE